MRILLKKRKYRGRNQWSADMTQMPGSPPLGFGNTKADAVADCFRQNLMYGGGLILTTLARDKMPTTIEVEKEK